MIAWSFEHLDEDEQDVFDRLSGFAGSFDIPDCDSVCAGPDLDPAGDAAPTRDAVEILAALVDKSMVQLVSQHGTRYQLLETLREYGHEQLTERASVEAVEARHLRWYVDAAERASIGLTGPDEASWSQAVA